MFLVVCKKGLREKAMKHILSNNDRNCINQLFDLVIGSFSYKERQEFLQDLKGTDFFEKEADPAIVGVTTFCMKIISKLYRNGETEKVREALAEYSKLECLSPAAQNDIAKISSLLEDMEKEEDPVKKELISARISTNLHGEYYAIETLRGLLNGNICVEEQAIIRKQMQYLFRLKENYSSEALENLKELLLLEPNNVSNFHNLLGFRGLNSVDFWSLVQDNIRQNINNIDYWERLSNRIDNDEDYDKTLDMYFALGKPLILDKFIILFLAYRLITREPDNPNLAIEFLVRQKESAVWDYEQELLLIEFAYRRDSNIEEVKKRINSQIRKNKNREKIILEIGQELFKYNLHKESLHCLDRIPCDSALIIIATNWKIANYTELSNFRKVEELFQEYTREGFPREFFIWLQNSMLNKSIPEQLLYRLLAGIYLKQEGKDFTSGNALIFKQIIFATEHIENSGLLRYKLWVLYEYIRRLKGSLVYKDEDSVICHYTKVDTIVHLAKYTDTNASRFRLSNVAYMNDPAEGKTFFEALSFLCEDSRKEKLDYMFSLLYGQEQFLFRNTYLTSFSLESDFLPMWVQYADNGKGCCLHVTCDRFGEIDDSVQKRITHDSSVISRSNKPVLYRVQYIKTNNEIAESLRKDFSGIARVLLDISDYVVDQEIAEMITSFLDEVRYLFKSIAYETEKEVRLIQSDFEGKAKLDPSSEPGRPPKLYLELEDDLQFHEVMLGPKVRNVREWAAYLGNCTNVDKVTKSSIQYE
jgi:hypothetical protein